MYIYNLLSFLTQQFGLTVNFSAFSFFTYLVFWIQPNLSDRKNQYHKQHIWPDTLMYLKDYLYKWAELSDLNTYCLKLIKVFKAEGPKFSIQRTMHVLDILLFIHLKIFDTDNIQHFCNLVLDIMSNRLVQKAR